MLPIPVLLAEQLARHEAHLAERFSQTKWLFPRRCTAALCVARFNINPSTVPTIERYVPQAEIRTASGRARADLHPHLFRHHLWGRAWSREHR